MAELNDQGLPVITTNGVKRVLAALPRSQAKAKFGPRFKDSFTVLPENQWSTITLAQAGWKVPVLNQGDIGQCVGAGSVAVFRQAFIDAGLGDIAFSMSYLYSLIDGGRDDGAVVSDARDALQKNGCCTLSTVPNGKIFRSQYSTQTADAEATLYRLDLAYAISGYAELGTALSMGFRVVDGLSITKSWENENFDSEGVPILDGVIGGHCTAYTGAMKYSSKWKSFIFQKQNSWDTTWGDGGRLWIAKDHLTYGGNQYDAWAIKSVIINPNASNLPAPTV